MDKLPYEELERMITEAKERVPVGSHWQHYKGSRYSIADIVIVEATNEVAVIYTSLDRPTVSFVRPLVVWRQTVEWGGHVIPRFTKVD